MPQAQLVIREREEIKEEQVVQDLSAHLVQKDLGENEVFPASMESLEQREGLVILEGVVFPDLLASMDLMVVQDFLETEDQVAHLVVTEGLEELA